MDLNNQAAVDTTVETALSFKDKALAFVSNTRNQKIAAGVAVGGLALYGVKKLYDRRQAKKFANASLDVPVVVVAVAEAAQAVAK